MYSCSACTHTHRAKTFARLLSFAYVQVNFGNINIFVTTTMLFYRTPMFCWKKIHTHTLSHELYNPRPLARVHASEFWKPINNPPKVAFHFVAFSFFAKLTNVYGSQNGKVLRVRRSILRRWRSDPVVRPWCNRCEYFQIFRDLWCLSLQWNCPNVYFLISWVKEAVEFYNDLILPIGSHWKHRNRTRVDYCFQLNFVICLCELV